MRKGNAKIGIVVGIVAFYSEVQPVDSVSTVNLEALPVLSSNLTDSSSVVIVERGESEASETSNSAVELYLEH